MKKLKKYLALFLTFSMLTSMLQLPVFAVGTSSGEVMDGSFVLNEDGTVASTETEAGHDTVAYEEDGFTLTKSAVKTGENQFDVTLKVVTSQTVTTSHSKAATVLVIDLSNSMNDGLGSSTRLAEAKEVAKQFLESYAGTDADADQYLSIVWFGTQGGVDKDWVNVAGGTGKNSYNDIYNYLDTLQAPHGSDKGGTNLDAGLTYANAQLAERASIDEQKNVVVITDGKPTRYLKSNGSLGGDGTYCNETITGEAAAAAAAVKENATVYTVCLAAEDDVCYTGASITICRHCEQTQDKHIKEVACDNCGEAKEQHDSFRFGGRTYYVCADASWPYGNNEYYDEETTLYCADGSNQYSAKTISGAEVTVGYFLSNDIATSASTAFNASTADELQKALTAIAESIESEGYTGAGTSVIDPMGDFITMGPVSIESVSVDGNALTWTLDPANLTKDDIDVNGDTTTYTYSITYPITLNTAAEGFKEVDENGDTKYYPTNGYTYLSVPQETGEPKKLAFNVPGVCGEIPEYDWTVEYYLEDESSINLKAEDKTYSLDKAENKGKAELHSSVYAPENYDKEYDGYTFAKGDMSTVITADNSKNVIRLYYNLKVAPVTVEHYYKTTTIAPDGTETVGEYVMDPTVRSEFAVIGKTYEAAEQMTLGGVAYDKIDKINPGKSIRVSETDANLIQFYYSRVDDQREPTTAQVNHVYSLSVYEVNPETGKYELVEKEPILEEKVQYSENKLAGQVYPVSTKVKEGYEGYVLNTEEDDYKTLAENGMSFVIKPAAEDNVRTLYFEKTEDNRKAATVTVEHYYTKNITEIVGGSVNNYNDPDGEVETESFNVYVGERFEADQENVYEGETYKSAETNADKLLIEEVKGGEVIKLYYDLSVAPKQAEVIANHYWRTFTEVTVELTKEVVNEETGEIEIVVIGTDTEIKETVDKAIEGIKYTGLYEGQKHVEAQQSWGEGYTFNKDSVDTVYAGDGDEVVMYYDKYAEADKRSDADITVHHKYTTYLTTVVDGEVKTLTIVSEPVVESYTKLKAGDEFEAVEKPRYNEKDYTKTTDEKDLIVTLQPGTNATIVIDYERSETQLTEATYTVNYVYNVYQMVVDENGETAYVLDTANSQTESFAPAEGEVFYVGQDVVVDTRSREGFTPSNVPETVVKRLTSGSNNWTFVYEKRNDLPQNTVTVNHYYTTTTIAVNGTSSESVREELGSPIVKYVGQTVNASANTDGGFTLVRSELIYGEVAPAETAAQTSYNVVVTEQPAVVNFYYEKTDNFSVPVTYSVAHEYYLYDWDGSLITATKPAPVTGTGFATKLWVVAPEAIEGYELVGATYNGEKLEDYNIILKEGKNEVVFRYEQTLARDFVNATVIHNYYKDEVAMQAENAQPEKQYVENVENLPEGSEFSAEKRDAEGYEFLSAAPDTMKIVVTEDGDNTIVINYVRAVAEYQVIHIYNRNGSEEGRTTETLSGLDGEVIKAGEIDRVTTYNGKTYTFKSVSEDIVLDADADETQTITLVYNRTTGGGGGGGGGTITPKPPVPQDPVPQPEPEQPEVEIPEEDIPLVDLPEEDVPVADLPEEDIPLADVPKTGDATALWMALNALSGTALAGAAILGRKKREDEEI